MNESSMLSQIAQKDRERLSGYRDLLDFYRGKQWPGRERWGEKRLTLNYARIFIDKMTSYLMAGNNYTVEAVEDTSEARQRAEQAEKSLAQVYEANNLEKLESDLNKAISGYRLMLVSRNPELLPELISGDSIEALDRSVKSAQELTARIKKQLETQQQAERVPPGAPGRVEPDVANLSAREKIYLGLEKK
jgi:hypothetical protein